MPIVSLPQSSATGVGVAPDPAELVKTKSVLAKIRRDSQTISQDLVTILQYLSDSTQKPYPPKGERWSVAKIKTASWNHSPVEKALVKYTLDFSYGPVEMETFGVPGIYHVVNKVRLANLIVHEPVGLNIEVFSVLREVRTNGRVEEIEFDVVIIFEGFKSGERYEKVNRFFMNGNGELRDVV